MKIHSYYVENIKINQYCLFLSLIQVIFPILLIKSVYETTFCIEDLRTVEFYRFCCFLIAILNFGTIALVIFCKNINLSQYYECIIIIVEIFCIIRIIFLPSCNLTALFPFYSTKASISILSIIFGISVLKIINIRKSMYLLKEK